MSNHPKLPTIKIKNLRFLSCAYITMEPDVNQEIECKSVAKPKKKFLKYKSLGGIPQLPRNAIEAKTWHLDRYLADHSAVAQRWMTLPFRWVS